MHPAQLPIAELWKHCEARRQRRSGPGGQHRNKVETAVVLTHRPSGIQGEASERRSQEQNRQQALHRLRVNLALHVRSANEAIAPSTTWQARCRNRRIAINSHHEDFPAMLAEALDALSRHAWDARQAAEWLACTPSQLIKFLQSESRALQQVNQEREAIGLRRLI